jgi:hypothetical protein
MLAHGQVIVGTPDGNLILQTMIKGPEESGGRISPGRQRLDIDFRFG